MPKIENVERLLTLFKKKGRERKALDIRLRVGFSAPYAIYVHENLEAHHPVGQAKFLEQPYRQLIPQLKVQILQLLKLGWTLPRALAVAGLTILQAAQALCPIDTGFLRASGYCRVEGSGIDVRDTGGEPT